ncbi:MAG: response regulator transcription factor [Gammaproteobacteria bacterium]|nr:response regulator transcription factor [Gammaproteobacteria bacterium]
MIRLIVVDDQRLVRKCICAKLESIMDFQVVGEAESAEQLFSIIAGLEFDVLLLDLNMPGTGGLEAASRLLAQDPSYKMVGLSMYTEGPYPRRFLGLGGSGYVSKEADTEELVLAVREASRGRTYISRDVAQHLALSAVLPHSGGNQIENLSRREIEVLQFISHGYGVDEIAVKMSLSAKTIAYHRRHLMDKLGATNDVRLTLIARNQGFADFPDLRRVVDSN